MWSGIGAALIGGSTSLLGGLMSGASSKKTAKTQFHREQYLMDKQFDNDLEMWHRQNEYNSPANQMKRLEKAGLNPNLMYSNGNVGNATSMPTMSKGSVSKAEGTKYDFDLGKLMPLMQMENLNAQNKLINAQTEAATQDALNKGLMNVRYGIENEYLPQQLQSNINKTKRETDLLGRNNDPINRIANAFMDEYGIMGGIIPRIYREEPSVVKKKDFNWDWFGK